MTGKTPRGRPLKYGEPTQRTHVHIPVSVVAELENLGKANGNLSVGELLVRGARLLLDDPTRAGLRPAAGTAGESGPLDA
jgi:hypothetical protein